MQANPFRRASAMIAALAALAGLSGAAHAEASAKIGAYKSRGHGRDKLTGRKPNRNSQSLWLSNAPHGGGAREVARRQMQLARGTLRTN